MLVTAAKYWLIKWAHLLFDACLVGQPALLACLPFWPACLFGLPAFLACLPFWPACLFSLKALFCAHY
jgi:hypothetical protein